MERPKKGFSIPIRKWLKEPELFAWAKELLAEDKIRREGYFDPEMVKRLWDIPIRKWLKEPELFAWAKELLAEDKIRREGYFDPEMVKRLWDDFEQRGIWRKQIWHLLRFESWLENEAKIS